MTLGPLVGEGRIAQVFAWHKNQVLKLFRAGVAQQDVEREARVGRLVHATGLAVPAVYDVVEVNGRFGIVLERVDGPSLLEELQTKPWKLRALGRTLADLHAATHACRVSGLPQLHERLARKIRSADLSPDRQAAALAVLGRLPAGDSLCHGDFHPHNILISAQGPVIIDWTDAAHGSPLADVARTALLFQLAKLPPSMPVTVRWLLAAFRGRVHRNYLQRYQQRRSVSQAQIAAWRLPVAAGRLQEGVSGESRRLLALIDQSLRG